MDHLVGFLCQFDVLMLFGVCNRLQWVTETQDQLTEETPDSRFSLSLCLRILWFPVALSLVPPRLPSRLVSDVLHLPTHLVFGNNQIRRVWKVLQSLGQCRLRSGRVSSCVTWISYWLEGFGLRSQKLVWDRQIVTKCVLHSALSKLTTNTLKHQYVAVVWGTVMDSQVS